MELRDLLLNLKILGIIGSILIIISEFLPWFSSYSLFEIYFITISGAFEDAFLYLFPIVSGLICLAAGILLITNMQFKIKSIILNIVGICFLLFFLFEFIPIHFQYLQDPEDFENLPIDDKLKLSPIHWQYNLSVSSDRNQHQSLRL